MRGEIRQAVLELRQRVTVLQAFAQSFRNTSPAASYCISLADEVHERLETLERLLMEDG